MKISGKPQGMTWREHLYGQAAGSLIVRAGRLAKKRGDLHEFSHLGAALAAGDTSARSHEQGCLAYVVLTRRDPWTVDR